MENEVLLHEELIRENTYLKEENTNLKDEIIELKRQLDNLKRMAFGQKSEKRKNEEISAEQITQYGQNILNSDGSQG